jgi:hypothetical protein
MSSASDDSPSTPGWAGRLLRPFAEVRPCEVATALVLAVTIFTILTAYYLLKVIREPLILLSSGAEVKSYAAAGQALLLIPVLRAHGAIAQRTGRLKLIAAVLLFCAGNLALFAVLFRVGVSIGLPFYLWVGTFNFLLVATFWSFANDIYTPEQGKRLFPLIGVGSTVGALAGAGLASYLLRHLGPMELMLLAAGLLVGTLGLFAWVSSHQRCRPRDRGTPIPASAPVRGRGGFEALLSDPYLALIGVIAIVCNWITNSGEYVLDRTLMDLVHGAGVTSAAEITRFIGGFKANYFWWVNALALLSQLPSIWPRGTLRAHGGPRLGSAGHSGDRHRREHRNGGEPRGDPGGARRRRRDLSRARPPRSPRAVERILEATSASAGLSRGQGQSPVRLAVRRVSPSGGPSGDGLAPSHAFGRRQLSTAQEPRGD